MKTLPDFSSSRVSQRGLSLIELMIALTIGLVVIGAVGSLFLGSRQAFRTNDNMARMQEGARYALHLLARDIRMAGYIGCGNLENIVTNTIANPPVPALSMNNAILGQDHAVAPATIGGITRPAGDTISIMGAFGGGIGLAGNLVPANANVQMVNNSLGFAANDILVVTNCTNADVFRATNVSSGASITTVAHANSNNTGNRIGTYGPDSFVLKMEQYTYFIGTNPTTQRRSLYRTSLTEGTVELVEDVWDFQVQFGIDTNDDDAADNYVDPTTVGTNWPQVVSARISIVMVSAENNITTSQQTYTLNGTAVAAGDFRMYQVFSTTVGIRNRLP